MFKVRNIQIEEIELVKKLYFINGLCSELRKKYESKLMHISDKELKDLVDNGYQKAKNYEFASDIHIAKFISLMVELHSDFDKEVWAVRILRNAYRDCDSAILKLELKAKKIINIKK